RLQAFADAAVQFQADAGGLAASETPEEAFHQGADARAFVLRRAGGILVPDDEEVEHAAAREGRRSAAVGRAEGEDAPGADVVAVAGEEPGHGREESPKVTSDQGQTAKTLPQILGAYVPR